METKTNLLLKIHELHVYVQTYAAQRIRTRNSSDCWDRSHFHHLNQSQRGREPFILNFEKIHKMTIIYPFGCSRFVNLVTWNLVVCTFFDLSLSRKLLRIEFNLSINNNYERTIDTIKKCLFFPGFTLMNDDYCAM